MTTIDSMTSRTVDSMIHDNTTIPSIVIESTVPFLSLEQNQQCEHLKTQGVEASGLLKAQISEGSRINTRNLHFLVAITFCLSINHRLNYKDALTGIESLSFQPQRLKNVY